MLDMSFDEDVIHALLRDKGHVFYSSFVDDLFHTPALNLPKEQFTSRPPSTGPPTGGRSPKTVALRSTAAEEHPTSSGTAAGGAALRAVRSLRGDLDIDARDTDDVAKTIANCLTHAKVAVQASQGEPRPSSKLDVWNPEGFFNSVDMCKVLGEGFSQKLKVGARSFPFGLAGHIPKGVPR